jgi:hypothetical protein
MNIINYLRNLFKAKPKQTPITRSGKDGEDLTPWEREQLAKLTCPDCGAHSSLLKGPQGGMSFNALCENCFSEFNIAIFPYRDRNRYVCMGERISDRNKGRKVMYGV